MKTLSAAIILLTWTLATASAALSAPKEFVDLYKSWDIALCGADMAALDRIYADEAKLTQPEGVDTKESWLKLVKSGDYKCSNPEIVELDVKTYGEVAVCTGVWKAIETFKGQTNAHPLRFTDVWVKRDGRWQVAASQIAEMKEPEKKPGPEHQPLAMGVGTWEWAEQAFETPFGPASTDKFTSEGRMIMRGFFFEERGKGTGADGKSYEWLAINGYNPEKGYFALNVDSDGESTRPWKNEYGTGKVEGNTWTWSWAFERKGKKFHGRSIMTFAADLSSSTYDWTYSEDGTTWKPWLKGTGKRLSK